MANDIWIGKKGFRYWYYRFRDSMYYSFTLIVFPILLCGVLIFSLIIPEISDWLSIRREVLAVKEKITILQNNIAFMSNLDRTTLNGQLQTATTVLPSVKDFSVMLNAINDASVVSGISLDDFTFQVGDITSSADKEGDTRFQNIGVIQITFVARGKLDQIKRFIVALRNCAPLSEVISLDGNGETVSVSVQFYQKFMPRLTIIADKPLQPISAMELGLLEQIATLKFSQGRQEIIDVPASASAIPLF
jgi:hypothetical protein